MEDLLLIQSLGIEYIDHPHSPRVHSIALSRVGNEPSGPSRKPIFRAETSKPGLWLGSWLLDKLCSIHFRPLTCKWFILYVILPEMKNFNTLSTIESLSYSSRVVWPTSMSAAKSDQTDKPDIDRDRRISDRLGLDDVLGSTRSVWNTWNMSVQSVPISEPISPVQVDFKSIGPIGLNRLDRHACKRRDVAWDLASDSSFVDIVMLHHPWRI